MANSSSGSSSTSTESRTDKMQWSVILFLKVAGLFILAGAAEIGGGWLVWKAMREGKPWWWAVIGSFVLAIYGFIPVLQPLDDFGRLYAIYGGIFIGMSFLWGRVFDGMRLDWGDAVGSVICLVGILVVMFWPREGWAGTEGEETSA